MGKDKLRRYAEIATFPTAFDRSCTLKGKWNSDYFKNDQPIVLELGCGRGEYTIDQALLHPHKNFIGIDVKGARLWRGAKTAFEESIPNAAFLRIQIEHLENYFEKNEVSEIWITFPDPQPQLSREKKRLTSLRFLNHYRAILVEGGSVHLKTDNLVLYGYTLETIAKNNLHLKRNTDHLYAADFLDDTLSIKTTYEKKYLQQGIRIKYIEFIITGG